MSCVNCSLYFQGQCQPCLPGQSVLDALLEAGHSIPYNCRSGVCRSCLLRTVSGRVSCTSQADISAQEQQEGYFLACQCTAETPSLTVDWPAAQPSFSAVVSALQSITPTSIKVSLIPKRPIHYQPGQHIPVWRDQRQKKSYYLCSPAHSTPLQFLVERCAGGEMSQWFFEEAQSGDTLWMRPPSGSCYYRASSVGAQIIISCDAAAGAALAMAQAMVQAGCLGPISVAIYHCADTQALLEDYHFPDSVRILSFKRDDEDLKALLQAHKGSVPCYVLGDAAVVMPWLEYFQQHCQQNSQQNGQQNNQQTGIAADHLYADVFSREKPHRD